MIMITAWYVRTGELQESHIFLQKTEKKEQKNCTNNKRQENKNKENKIGQKRKERKKGKGHMINS